MVNLKGKAFVTLAFVVALGAKAAAPSEAQAQTPAGSRSKAGEHAQTRNAAKYYSCPMHPEVKATKAGRCPKCGMELRLTRAEPSATAGVSAGESRAMNPPAAADTSAGEKMMIPDVELLDQDGRTVHFYSDLVKGRVVAINFIFTTCTTICPPLGATFARVQKDLAGRDVQLISISVDPATDTPERLKAWGAKFHAGPAWTFVTGQKPLVDRLLRALGASTASPQDHSPTVLIGNDARGQWKRSYGLAPPRQLVQLIKDAIEGRLDAVKQEGAQQ
jgi:cytochrome oxidase Cu insertion factor (SCO1/SenC/PrrC family)